MPMSPTEGEGASRPATCPPRFLRVSSKLSASLFLGAHSVLPSKVTSVHIHLPANSSKMKLCPTPRPPPHLKVGSCAPSHRPLVCLPPTHQSSQGHMTNPCSVASGPEDAVCSRLPQTRLTSMILYSSQERQFIKCNFLKM